MGRPLADTMGPEEVTLCSQGAVAWAPALREGQVHPPTWGWGPSQLQHHPCPESLNLGVNILKKPLKSSGPWLFPSPSGISWQHCNQWCLYNQGLCFVVFKENKIDYVKNKLAPLVYNWNQALNVDSTKIITANYLQDFYLTILRENMGSQR